LNIYIYGNHSFKKEIHETLSHSNIKFKLGDYCLIKEIEKLSELKEIIQNNPKDFYLIDDAKIIKKNQIKFFAPKDGIDEDFLINSGISDLSIDSLAELPKYILKRYEEIKENEPDIQEPIINNHNDILEKKPIIELDDELAQLLANEAPLIKKEISENKSFEDDNLEDLFDIGRDINLGESEDFFIPLENALQNNSKNEFDDVMNFNDNFGLNNISLDYDDRGTKNYELYGELGDLEPITESDEDDMNDVFEDLDFLEEIFGTKKEELGLELGIETIPKTEDFKEELEIIKEEKSNDNKNVNESLQGDKMNNDEFFELDSLNEKDLFEALNYTDTEMKKNIEKIIPAVVEKNVSSISISNSTNVDELAQLISKLLSNKTLEITIKIKE